MICRIVSASTAPRPRRDPSEKLLSAIMIAAAIGSDSGPTTPGMPATTRATAIAIRTIADLPPLRRPDPAELEAAKEAAAADPALRKPPLATTLVAIATDATLTKAQCQKVSGIGHDGLARAINPVHTMFDGDTAFTLATCERAPQADPLAAMEHFHGLLEAAGDCVTRAVARAVLAAQSTHGLRGYREAFPSAFA